MTNGLDLESLDENENFEGANFTSKLDYASAQGVSHPRINLSVNREPLLSIAESRGNYGSAISSDELGSVRNYSKRGNIPDEELVNQGLLEEGIMLSGGSRQGYSQEMIRLMNTPHKPTSIDIVL